MLARHSYFFVLVFFIQLFFQNVDAQPLAYSNTLKDMEGKVVKKSSRDIFFIIARDAGFENIVFMEKQKIQTDEAGKYDVNIGNGESIFGSIDSIMWSDGAYFLKVISDTGKSIKPLYMHQCQLRDPSDVTPEGLEGDAGSIDNKQWGSVSIPNKKNKYPKKITVDLSTSYINTYYPGGEYPIYRHYEWFDANGDGEGNSLALTYSEKTTHAFFENGSKLGEVKLYGEAFQEVLLNVTLNSIKIDITKPKSVKNYAETYAIKGPWKILYHVEW